MCAYMHWARPSAGVVWDSSIELSGPMLTCIRWESGALFSVPDGLFIMDAF